MKQRYKICWMPLIALLLAVGSQSCKKELSSLSTYAYSDNTKSDTLRVFNLLPDSAKAPKSIGYVIYMNDVLYSTLNARSFTSPDLNVYSPPAVLPVPAQGGTFVFKIAKYTYTSNVSFETPPAKPDAKRVIFTSAGISIAPHSGYGNLVLYVDAAGKYQVQYLPQSTTNEAAPAPGKYKIRVVNFGYHIPYATSPQTLPYQLNSAGKRFTLQLQYADSTQVPGLDNIAFATASKYVQLDYGAQQFLLYNTDSTKYIKNTFFNNMSDAFGLGVAPATNTYSSPYYANYTYSNSILKPLAFNYNCTYPFNAGGCYTMYVFGNRSSVVLDKQYGAGQLDNFGKIQIVNANPNQQDVQVSITSAAGEVQLPSVVFGKYSNPITLPAGDVTCTFSSGGKTLFTYNTKLSRLSNYTLYYISDLNGIPQVFPQSVSVANLGVNALNTLYPVLEQAYISCLNLSADVGAVYYTATSQIKGNNEIAFTADNNYKNLLAATAYDARKVTVATVSDLIPDSFGVRLTATRADTLSTKLVAKGLRSQLFRSLPAAGNYTLTLAGLLNTTDPAKKLRLIMVKQSNYISKAN